MRGYQQIILQLAVSEAEKKYGLDPETNYVDISYSIDVDSCLPLGPYYTKTITKI